MKILRSSRMRAIGHSLQNQRSTLDTQIVSLSVNDNQGNCIINYAPPNMPLPFLFGYCSVEYPYPTCTNKDTTSGITTPTCKDVLQTLDLPVNLKIFLQSKKLID